MEESDLPRHVVWYDAMDCGIRRKFFRIEHHPALEKDWSTSKSSKLTDREKLDQAIAKLAELEAIEIAEPEKPLRDQLIKEFDEAINSV